MNENAKPLLWIRLGALILAAVLITVRIVTNGLDLFILVATALLILIGLALQAIERRTRRPLKTHLRWALASVALGLLLVAMPFALSADVIVGAILWIGLSAAGLVWAVYYERSEPL